MQTNITDSILHHLRADKVNSTFITRDNMVSLFGAQHIMFDWCQENHINAKPEPGGWKLHIKEL